MISPSGVAYVFLAVPYGTDLEFHQTELEIRCFVARGLNPTCQTVVGIGTEYFEANNSSALFLVYLNKPEWTAEDDIHSKKMQKELGYFVKPEIKSTHEDEYPTS